MGRDIAEHRSYSEETSQSIDAEVHRIISECYDRAHQILSEAKDELDKLADRLLEAETIESKELDELLGPSARDLQKHNEQNEEETKEIELSKSEEEE